MISLKELAKELDVKPYSIWNFLTLYTTGTVEGVKIGNRVHFDEANANIIRNGIKAIAERRQRSSAVGQKPKKVKKVVYGREVNE